MRKLMVVLMVAVLGTGVLAACSDDADDAAASTTQAADRDEANDDERASTEDGGDEPAGEGEPAAEPGQELGLDGWADEFCTSFVAWLDDREANIDGIDTSIAVTDYPAQQAALATFYEGEAEAAGELAERVEQGSVPDIEGGEDLVAELASLFEELQGAAATAAEAVAALDPASPSFEADGQELNLAYQESLEATGERFLQVAERHPDLEGNATLEEQCVS